MNPPAAPDGLLAASTSYSLVPVLTQLDGATAMNPAGDADRVEYFLAAPGQPDQAAATPVAIARTWPFAYSFVAPYAGNGTDPWPYSVWAQAVDTSQNRSALVRLPLQVLPNRPPAIGAVGASAVAPVMGTFYAGSLVRATLTGLDDPDAAQLTVSVELRRENDSGPALDAPAARLISRPAGGWSQLSAPVFDLRIPVTLAEGTALLARARVVDPQGANATKDSPVFAIADDATPPAANGLVVRLSPAGTAVSQLTIGQRFTVEFRARDAETAVRTVSLAFSGTFATPVPATLVAGTPDIYRTAEIVVPVGIPPAGVDVTLTASAEDQGGNTQQTTALVRVAPTADPTAPQAQWLSPWEGAPWPSGYTSVISPGAGTALLLRLRATDRDSVSGNDVPGSIVSVQVKGPADRLGTLSSTFTDATLFSGTGIGEGLYQAFWRVPNDVPEGTTLRFLARVTDTGGNATETYVQMSATRPRRVYEGTVTAVPDSDVLPAPAGAEDAPLFLLDGATVSLTPLATGVPRAFGSIVLLTGALEPLTPRPSILTAPEITSFASAVLFQPLDLTVTQLLGIGHGSRVDLSGRGLLGGLGAQFVALPGEVASGGRAGGSHGGLGGVTVSAGGGVPGGITDSVRDPALPGGGGGAGVLLAGGNGGGVVRIDGEGAVLALYGDLLADGQSRTEGGDGGGGAGGAIRLRVRRVEGRGTVSARGGNAVGAGGGGGGRVSLSTVEPSTGPLPISFSASGGRDGGSAGRDGGAGTVLVERRDAVSGLPVAPAALSLAALGGRAAELTPLPGMGSGAGTGFTPAAVSNVDLAGSSLRATGVGVRASLAGERVLVTDPAAPGGPVTWELPVSQQTFVTGTGAAGTATHSTRLSLSPSLATTTALTAVRDALLAGRAVHAVGRSRFGTVEVASGARLVAEDDLEAGLVDPPALNSRASLSIDASSRALLRGEGPLIATTTAVPAPGSAIDANTTISLAYGVTDPVGLSLVETTWSLGTGTQTTVLDEALQLTSGPLSLVVPPTQPAGPVSYRVRAVDRAGRVADLTHTWTVRADTVPPALLSLDLVPSAVNDAYLSGDVVTITVRASDNVAVKRIRMTLDGQTRDFSSTIATFVFTAPPVAAQTPFVLSVELLDYAGNTTPVTRTLQVSPAGGPGAPVVRIDCPSSGALLPSGYAAFAIQATATDDVGVARVEFLREGETTPFSTKTPVSGNPPTFVATSDPIALPAVSQLTTVRFRVRAVDGTTASSERVVEIRVVPGTVDLLAAGPNDWSALANQIAVLRSGTLVLDQPRTFGGLIVLRGAQITHSPADALGTQRLDVATPGDLYVECGAALDVTAKGWPAQTSQPGIAPATLGSGGSHIGRGGQDSGAPGATYGSVRRPDEYGGGGGSAGTRGGGRIRLSAGTLQLDGSLLANGGDATNTGAGAGGSVLVTATNVYGNGALRARGGGGIPQAGGGGGAIAVEYAGSAAGLWTSLASASGGQQSTTRSRNGGAGSVLVLGPATPLGSLTVENGPVPSSQGGDLPSLGSGVAQPGSGGTTLVTDRLTDVPASFAGHHVEIRAATGAVEGLYAISTAANGITGKTLLLIPVSGGAPASVDPGDLWQGVNAFDSVQISSSLASGDPVRTGTASLSGPIASGPDATTIPAAFTAAAATIEGRVSA
ncbi:MAG: hypothetical protein JNK60_13680, partial [Acidobacteria bacterium]|nr:hypothetical protein [Acidobacteriota bacterium]